MSRILVVDDEEAQRTLAGLHLESASHEVVVASSAVEALGCMLACVPDVVLADVAMPGMDGFALLAAIRANAAWSKVPLVFLTALDPSAVMPKALALGVSEVLLKPLRRDELLAAIGRCLRPAAPLGRRAPSVLAPGMTTALRTEDVFASRSSHQRLDQSRIEASVLFADIRNFSTFAERLSAVETAEIADLFLGSMSEQVGAHHGRTVKTMGDGLLALFQDADAQDEGHAGRALKSALKIVLSARRFGEWLAQRFPGRSLPEFAVGVGVHTGDLLVCQLTTEAGIEQTVIGDTVNVAARLEAQTKVLGWSVVASAATLDAAGARYVIGGQASVTVKGRDAPVDVRELAGLAPREDSTVQDWRVYRQFASALDENSGVLQRHLRSAAGRGA